MMRRLMRHGAAALCGALLVTLPTQVASLGLGSIEQRSVLNEPFEARIPLRSVQPGDLDSMQVRLATPEQFGRAGVERPFVLSRLRFEIVPGGADGDYIRIRTEEPLSEPFLNFLIEVDWPRGRVVREYTVLLDPPVYGAAITAGVKEAVTTTRELPPLAEAPEQEAPASAEAPAMAEAATGEAAPEPSAGAVAMPESYGPVKADDTLWSLASRYRPDENVSVQQMMLAMLNANPEAFNEGNVNGLRRGAVLQLPSREQIASMSRDAALEEVKRQYALWEQYRQTLTTRVAAAPSGAAASSGVSDGGDAASGTGAGADGGEDRLELLASGSAATGSGAGSASAAEAQQLRNELNLAIEQADSIRSENEELRSRLEDTEELVSDLQRLVDLKDENIAALQRRLAEQQAAAAEQAEAAAGTGEQAAAADQPKAKPKDKPAAKKPADEPEAKPKPEKKKPKVPLPPAQEPSLLDSISAALPVDPVILAAGAGGLLVLGGGVAMMRRRRAAAGEGVEVTTVADDEGGPDEALARDAVTEVPGGDDDATELPAARRGVAAGEADEDEPATEVPAGEAEAAPPPAAPEPTPGTAAEEDEEDPLAEVNVYLAYERFDQAEELVRGAVESYPDRHEYRLKLLEIFYAAKDLPRFQAAARELQEAVGDSSPMMEKARSWWSDLSPGRELFAPPAEEAPAAAGAEEEDLFDVTGGDEEEEAGAATGVDFDLGFDSEEEAGAGEDTGSLDFDLGFDEGEEEAAGAPAEDTEEAAAEDSDTGGLDFDLGFDEGEEEAAGAPAEDMEEAAAEDSDTGGLDFVLDEGEETAAAPAGEAGPEAEGEAGEGDEALDFDLGTGDDLESFDLGEEEDAGEQEDAGVELDLGDESSDDTGDAGGLDLDIGFDEDEEGEAPRGEAAEATPAPEEGDALDFDLGAGEEEDTATAGPAAEAGETAETDQADEAGGDEEIDFDLSFGEEDEAAGEEGTGPAFETVKLRVDDTGAPAGEQKGAHEKGAHEKGADEDEIDFDLDMPGDEEPDQAAEAPAEDIEEAGAEDSDTGGLDLDIGADDQAAAPGAGDDDEIQLDDSLLGGDEETGGLDLDIGAEDEGGGLDIGAAEGEAESAEGDAERADAGGAGSLDLDIGGEEESAGGAPETSDDSAPELPDESADASPEEAEQTQFMLRDVPAPDAGGEDEEDDDDHTLVLGRGPHGDVDAIQNKLDLALAYIDMEDTDGARGILSEVMAEGNDSQKQQAEELLAKLD